MSPEHLPEAKPNSTPGSKIDQLLESRRSVRKYISKAVPKEIIRSMVASAITVPSPSNSQPVRSLQIVSKPIKDRLKKEMEAGLEKLLNMAERQEKSKKLRNVINYYWRHSIFMLDAPVLFAVGTMSQENSFSQRLKQADMLADNFRENIDVDITTGLFLAAFILKAQEQGLGTCILTAPMIFIRNMDFLINEKDLIIKCFVTAGFADEKPDPKKKLSIEDVYDSV
ncbi:MAG: nitroreductase family protein [Pseudomonadota bacterium]